MGRHILSVDDGERINRLVEMILQRAGFRVSLASDGEEALEKIRESRPDLILMDMEMPRMDGRTLMQRLRSGEATAEIPIIVVTVRTQEEAIAAMRDGADRFFQKPFNPRELIAAIEEILSAREAGRAPAVCCEGA